MREEKSFVKCPNPSCNRPYKKGKDFPEEVCPFCVSMGVEYGDWDKEEKE